MPRRKTAHASPEHDVLSHNHVEASVEHAQWLEDLKRWQREYRDALHQFAVRMAPELELENHEEAMLRHEAAIAAHEEANVRHESAMKAADRGLDHASDEYDVIHTHFGARHERSREEHRRMARRHQAILDMLARFERRK